MRASFKVSAILAVFLFPPAAVAQTGEFAATVPGEVVHRGYALQDQWQRLRSAPPARQSVGTLQKSKSLRSEAQEATRRLELRLSWVLLRSLHRLAIGTSGMSKGSSFPAARAAWDRIGTIRRRR